MDLRPSRRLDPATERRYRLHRLPRRPGRGCRSAPAARWSSRCLLSLTRTCRRRILVEISLLRRPPGRRPGAGRHLAGRAGPAGCAGGHQPGTAPERQRGYRGNSKRASKRGLTRCSRRMAPPWWGTSGSEPAEPLLAAGDVAWSDPLGAADTTSRTDRNSASPLSPADRPVGEAGRTR